MTRALPDDGSLRQPDQRSCGASSLVVARMLLDDTYAWPDSAADFRDEVLGVHRRVTGPRDAAGHLQLPWPRALGTPPWAVARDLSALGTTYRTRLVLHRAAAYDRVVAVVRAGHPVPIYVGNRWLPRHVVLAVAEHDAALEIYNPGTGRRVPVTRDAWTTGHLQLSGWDGPWFVVLPVSA